MTGYVGVSLVQNRLFDDNGKPVAGAHLRGESQVPTADELVGSSLAKAVSDEQGRFGVQVTRDWHRRTVHRAALIRQWSMGGVKSLPLPGPVNPAAVAKPAQTEQVINATFEEWAGGIPIGWTLGIGATTGSQEPKSTIHKADGPALMLQGDVSTQAWQIATRSFPVDPRKYYRQSSVSSDQAA